MNILYLNNSVHLGGDTKCILQLCKEFNKSNNVIIASQGGVLQGEFERIGIRHFNIRDVEPKNLINIMRNISILKEIIRENEIQIVHSHHRMTTLISKLATLRTNVKVIHSQHLCIKDKFLFTNLALKNIKVITVSESAKKILSEKAKLNTDNITTIYNTVETISKSNIVDERLLSLKKNGYFVVGQVSRIVDYKGIYDFVDVVEKTIVKNDKIRFVFLGTGIEKEKMEEYIKMKEMEEYIFLLGAKENVIEHLKYIDLMILCSYIEGLPLTPLEAFSQKVPVIATNIDGTNEEIINNVNGYLVEKKDIDGFVNKIEYLYKNKDEMIKMKENAYNIFCEKFNKEQYISKHKYIYEI